MSVPAATPVPWLLRACLHLLVVGLLVLTVVRAFLGYAHTPGAVLAAAVAVAGAYAVGPWLPAVRRSWWAAGTWLVLLLGLWVVLLWLTPDAIWLAFAWFFLLLHLLPWRMGLVGVGLTAVIAVGGFGWHQPALTAAMVIGPLLGAGVAVVTVWAFGTLSTESERRRALITELRRTQEELAAAERRQGMLTERERLAREIHDTLAQGLSSIQLLLRAATRDLQDHPDLARTAAHVEQARTTAQANLDEARRLVQALAPADLQGGSLVRALQRLSAASTASASGDPATPAASAAGPAADTAPQSQATGAPQVTFHQEGSSAALPTPVEVALLRIAQAAVANAIRHAHADRIAVTLTTMGQQVSLDVVDDGVGFDPVALDRRPGPDGGFGLVSMRSRAADLGGLLTVESSPGAGTAVAVTFPLTRAEEAA